MEIDIKFKDSGLKDYKIYIDSNPKISLDTKVAIVTNPKVAGLHLKTILDNIRAKEIYIITIRDGEEYKNEDSLNYILENLFIHKFDRGSILIALGGGVIGDMVGFAASIYQRGIDFIQIPTTLLSQVDASVGGKTGINNRFGKNLIGAFHQPKSVYIQTEFLDSLPKREFNAGVAEIIKMAVMFDKSFYEWLKNNSLNEKDNLRVAIKRSIELKADVVSKDEKEKGIRSVLNYGHTFAHVIENETAYKRYLHGEAVAIGINMANHLALKLDLLSKSDLDDIKALLLRYELPTRYEISDVDKFYDAFFLDKKVDNESIKFILPNSIGSYKIMSSIKKDLIIETLKSFGKVRR